MKQKDEPGFENEIQRWKKYRNMQQIGEVSIYVTFAQTWWRCQQIEVTFLMLLCCAAWEAGGLLNSPCL